MGHDVKQIERANGHAALSPSQFSTSPYSARGSGGRSGVLPHHSLLAQQPKPNEFQVKATYLYNFGRFVKWPGTVPVSKGDSFPVCVLGRDPFGPILDSTLAGETLDDKPVALRRISKPQEAGECRILFISSTEEKRLKEILVALDESGVLTVSDMPGFTRRGGMNPIRSGRGQGPFRNHLARAESARLVLSSELLKVAASVKRNSGSGD